MAHTHLNTKRIPPKSLLSSQIVASIGFKTVHLNKNLVAIQMYLITLTVTLNIYFGSFKNKNSATTQKALYSQIVRAYDHSKSVEITNSVILMVQAIGAYIARRRDTNLAVYFYARGYSRKIYGFSNLLGCRQNQSQSMFL